MDCLHGGENGFLATNLIGFVQNPSDPRCIHCAWNEVFAVIPQGWWFDRLYFLLNGWAIEVASPDGECIRSVGATPAIAMDEMKKLLEQHNDAKKTK